MKLGDLRLLLSKLASEIGEDSEIWLSCDEEGNEFLPMSANPDLSVAFDNLCKRVVLFPTNPYNKKSGFELVFD
jgi:hypothetical protein